MVMACFNCCNKFCHTVSGYACILVLISACADSHIEAIKVCSVIYRYPIVTDVIKVNYSFFLMRKTKSFYSPCTT